VDEAAYSYQEEGAAPEASLGLDCDEDFAGAEQIEAESRSAVDSEIDGSQELLAGLGAVERAAQSVFAAGEETLGPFRTVVAERWSRVCEALQAEHTASAKRWTTGE